MIPVLYYILFRFGGGVELNAYIWPLKKESLLSSKPFVAVTADKSSRRLALLLCVCSRVKVIFPPICIQHNQCFLPTPPPTNRDNLYGHKLQYKAEIHVVNIVKLLGRAMPNAVSTKAEYFQVYIILHEYPLFAALFYGVEDSRNDIIPGTRYITNNRVWRTRREQSARGVPRIILLF